MTYQLDPSIDFQLLPEEVEIALNDACSIINHWATKKGWNDTPDSISHKAEQIALMHSELSEALESIRSTARDAKVCVSCQQLHTMAATESSCCGSPLMQAPALDDKVPTLSGEAAELADVLIRIFHYCGKRNIDLGEAVRLKHKYNITRPYRHGKTI